MNFVCLWSPSWRDATDAPQRAHLVGLAATLLSAAPRVFIGERVRDGARECVIWADARGLNARVLAHALLDLVRDDGVTDVCAGVASTPVAAQVAAVQGTAGVTVIEPGDDRTYISLFPVSALEVPQRIKPLLFALGVKTCGELAALTRESIEVRLGAESVPMWRLARADDERSDTLFAPMPRELPHATLDWVDYEVTDPARLLFVINALLENVCDALMALGQGGRELTIDFALTDRTTYSELLRASRPTANRQMWMRLVRTAIDRIKLPCAVTGIAVRATRVTGREERQTDLFDRGLATASATEAVLARLAEDQGRVLVVPRNSGHPLLEQRTTWAVREESPAYAGGRGQGAGGRAGDGGQGAELTLQLAPAPRPILVETVMRRDHFAPARYRDGAGWHEIVNAAGPDRVSGGRWDSAKAYAREYFRCVTRDGSLVWLFRAVQGKESRWYLHGWWD